jgi:hypothetical protein
MIVSSSPELVRAVIADRDRAAHAASVRRAIHAAQACCRAATGGLQGLLRRATVVAGAGR